MDSLNILINARLNTTSATQIIKTQTKQIEQAINRTPIQLKIETSVGMKDNVNKITSDYKKMFSGLMKDFDMIQNSYNKQLFSNFNKDLGIGNVAKSAKESAKIFENAFSSGNITEKMRQLNPEITKVNNSIKGLGEESQKSAQSFGSMLIKFTEWYLLAGFVTGVIDKIKDSFKFINEQSKVFTNLQMEMTNTNLVFSEITNTANNYGLVMGTTTDKVMKAIGVFSTYTSTMDDVLLKSKAAIILSNITGQNIEQTSDSLMGTMAQYGLSADSAMHVADIITSTARMLSLDYPRGIQEISEGLRTVGSVAKSSKVSIESLSAMIGMLTEKNRKSGTENANALRTIFGRILNVGEDADPEAFKKVEKGLDAIGIKIREIGGNGQTLKPVGDILENLSAKWSSLSDVQKQAISFDAAGMYRKNTFITLMENYQDVLKNTEAAINSEGVAEQKQEIFNNSLQASINRLTATWEKLYLTAINSKAWKSTIEGVTKVLAVIESLSEKFGFLPLVIGTTLTALLLFNKAFMSMSIIQTVIAGVSGAVTRLALSLGASTVAATTFGTALGTIAPFAIIAVSAAIVGLISNQKSLSEQVQDNIDKFNEQNSQVNELISSYKSNIELAKTNADAKDKLYEIESKLVIMFGDSAKAIDLENGKLDDNIAKIKELSNVKVQEFIDANKKIAEENKKELAKEQFGKPMLGARGGITDSSEISDYGDAPTLNIEEYIQKLKDLRHEISTGGYTVKSESSVEAITDLNKEIDKYEEQLKSLRLVITKVEEAENKLNNTTSETKAETEQLEETTNKISADFEDLGKQVKATVNEVKDLNDIQSDLAKNNTLSADSLIDLITKYPELLNYIHKTKDGYMVEAQGLELVKEALVAKQIIALETESGITSIVKAELETRLSLYGFEIEGINTLNEARTAALKMTGQITGSNVKEFYDLKTQLESLAKINALKDLLKSGLKRTDTTKKKGSDPAPIPYQDLSAEFVKAYNAQAELDEGLAKSLEKQIKIADSAKDYNKEINLTNKLIDIRKKKITDLESSNKKITSDADRVRSTTNRDTTKWFDPNGFETSTYLNLIKSFEGKTDNASKRELDNIKRIFEALKNLKQGYMANNEEISNQIDLIDEQKQNIKKLNEEKLKLFEDTENQIMDLLKKSHQKELDGLEKSLNKYKKYIDEKKKKLDEFYDEQDYKEKLAEDSQNILLSQNEINKYTPAALSGDLEAINKIKELKEQQAEDEKNLAKTQRDYEKDLRNKNLDDNLDSFETFIDSQKQIQEDALKDSALKLEAQKILTGETLEEVQNAIVNLFTVTSENATTAGLVIQNNLIDNLTKVLDIYKELDKLTGGSLNSSILPSKQGIVLKNSIGSRLNMAKATTNLIPNLSTPTPKPQPTGTGNIVFSLNVDGNVTPEVMPKLKNTMGEALKKIRNEMYNKGQR
jgi:TP901 family phage tail tape measure protein